MPKTLTAFSFAIVFTIACSTSLYADDWPQFRGPGGRAWTAEKQALPAEIGPERHLLWKKVVPTGHSSPVIVDGRIYLTAFDKPDLVTMALDAATGDVFWKAPAEYKKLESVHRIGSPATPSVATDGELVVSFFGSSGLHAYNTDGQLLWRKPMGPFNNSFGAASSPLLVDDKIVLVQDHDTGSFLAAYNRDGELLWKAERPNFRRNYCTPVVWDVNGKKQVVVAGSAHLTSYDLQTGELIWTIRGICRVVSSTPVVGDDGRLYVAATGGGETPPQPTFDELLADSDANNNGALEESELPKSPIRSFFVQFDRDADKSLDRTEYETIREIFSLAQTVAMAIEPGGAGDITETHIAWTYTKGIPRNSSPIYANGSLLFIKDGGILTSLNAATGELQKQGRLRGTGNYFSSPIVGDGKLYVLNERGLLSVVTAEGDWQQLADADFGEDCYATPAITNGRIYIRTVETLYCFGGGIR